MELHPRVQMIDTLLAESAQKRTALTHALNAKEHAEQGVESTHGAPLTDEEEGLKYEHDLWQKAEIELNDLRKVFVEVGELEQQRGVSQ